MKLEPWSVRRHFRSVPGSPRPFMRRAQWTEIDKAGNVTNHQLIFANPQTARSRLKRGIRVNHFLRATLPQLFPSEAPKSADRS